MLSRLSLFVAGLFLMVGLAACGGNGADAPDADTADTLDPDTPTTEVTIHTVDDQMLYEDDRFTVPAGEEISLTVDNSGTTSPAMVHNVVILDTMDDEVIDRVGQAALEAGAPNYIPEDDAIMAYTEMADPGEMKSMTFTAPSEPGEYRFICTYPGHYGVMQGTMVVAEA
jgi:azurin